MILLKDQSPKEYSQEQKNNCLTFVEPFSLLFSFYTHPHSSAIRRPQSTIHQRVKRTVPCRKITTEMGSVFRKFQSQYSTRSISPIVQYRERYRFYNIIGIFEILQWINIFSRNHNRVSHRQPLSSSTMYVKQFYYIKKIVKNRLLIPTG